MKKITLKMIRYGLEKKGLNKTCIFQAHMHILIAERKRKLNRPAETINWKI